MRRIGRTRRSPEPVGEAKNDVVRPYIGIQRSAALEVGIVDREAEFVVSDGGDMGARTGIRYRPNPQRRRRPVDIRKYKAGRRQDA
jgi:hypothetical protein